jgi:hypothetical protein
VSEDSARELALALGRPVHVVDTLDLVQPFVRYHENGLGPPSMHWHEEVERDVAHNMSVRGIITDMLAQMVFNVDFGPRASRLGPVAGLTQEARNLLWESLPLRYCDDCPPKLMPYSIVAEPSLKCVDGYVPSPPPPPPPTLLQPCEGERCYAANGCFARLRDHALNCATRLVHGYGAHWALTNQDYAH